MNTFSLRFIVCRWPFAVHHRYVYVIALGRSSLFCEFLSWPYSLRVHLCLCSSFLRLRYFSNVLVSCRERHLRLHLQVRSLINWLSLTVVVFDMSWVKWHSTFILFAVVSADKLCQIVATAWQFNHAFHRVSWLAGTRVAWIRLGREVRPESNVFLGVLTWLSFQRNSSKAFRLLILHTCIIRSQSELPLKCALFNAPALTFKAILDGSQVLDALIVVRVSWHSNMSAVKGRYQHAWAILSVWVQRGFPTLTDDINLLNNGSSFCLWVFPFVLGASLLPLISLGWVWCVVFLPNEHVNFGP